jgi:hypothetical protein
MMKFSELEERHAEAMSKMCDCCYDEDCINHGGTVSVCESFVDAEDVYDYLGDREYDERGDR